MYHVLQKIQQLTASLVPELYRINPQVLNKILLWLLFGILVRIIIMPFAFHGDLLLKYWEANALLGTHYQNVQSPNLLIEAITILSISSFTPIQQFLSLIDGSSLTASIYWLPVLDSIYIFRTIFLLKLPYLFIDILISVLFLHIFSNKIKCGLRAYKFWIFNPIIIFAVYVFGRFEVIAIFFILLCIYLLKENHTILAALSLGLAIYSRYYALLILPLFLILFCRTWKEKLKITTLILAPLIAYNVLTYSQSGTFISYYFFSSHFADYLLGMKFQIWEAPNQSIFIFVIAYSFILLYVYYREKSDNPIVDFTAYSLIIFLLMYSTSLFHPQYFAWFIPFLAVYWGYTNENSLIGLFCLQVICFIFYTFYWGQSLATFMFASINPSVLIVLPSPLELIDQVYPGLTFLNIMRSVFSAVLLFMVLKIFLIQRRGPC